MEDALQEMKTAMNNRNMWDIMSILERYPQIIYERYPSSDGSNHIVFNRLIALGLEDGVSESLKGMVSSDLITMCTKSNGYNPFHYAVEAMRWRSMITILTDFTYEDIDTLYQLLRGTGYGVIPLELLCENDRFYRFSTMEDDEYVIDDEEWEMLYEFFIGEGKIFLERSIYALVDTMNSADLERIDRLVETLEEAENGALEKNINIERISPLLRAYLKSIRGGTARRLTFDHIYPNGGEIKINDRVDYKDEKGHMFENALVLELIPPEADKAATVKLGYKGKSYKVFPSKLTYRKANVGFIYETYESIELGDIVMFNRDEYGYIDAFTTYNVIIKQFGEYEGKEELISAIKFVARKLTYADGEPILPKQRIKLKNKKFYYIVQGASINMIKARKIVVQTPLKLLEVVPISDIVEINTKIVGAKYYDETKARAYTIGTRVSFMHKFDEIDTIDGWKRRIEEPKRVYGYIKSLRPNTWTCIPDEDGYSLKHERDGLLKIQYRTPYKLEASIIELRLSKKDYIMIPKDKEFRFEDFN